MDDEQVELLREINERQRREEERLAGKLQDQQRALKGCLIAAGAFMCLLIGTCILIVSEESGPEVRALAEERKRCGNEGDAFLYSKELVRRQLKSPSTAEFPSIHEDPDVRIEALECGTYRVFGWVDAMNGFGAVLRHRYAAQLVHDAKDDSWRGKVVFEDD